MLLGTEEVTAKYEAMLHQEDLKEALFGQV